ncbi:hypothetical protein C8J57DRAFT_1021282, partial [Mycena rebaudengoi]
FRTTHAAPPGKTALLAEIIIAADDSFVLYVNGREVGTSTDYRTTTRLCVALRPCGNMFAVFAVGVGNIGSAPNPARLLAAIEITYSEGTRETVGTDPSWCASPGIPASFAAVDFDDASWTRAASITKFLWPPSIIP